MKSSGLSVKKVSAWLSKQPTYTLHRPLKRKFPRRKYVTRAIDDNWQMDLCEMPKFDADNDGYHYILTIIDVFSRFAFARALKTKTGIEVSAALKDVFTISKRQPHHIQVDGGTEFFNQHVLNLLKIYNIQLYSVYSEIKCGIIERFNRSLKDRMYRYFTYTGSYRWIDVLPDLIKAYNNSQHSSIKLAPADVNKENETDVWLEQYKDLKPATKTKFKIGDTVRISKAKKTFNRGFTKNWTFEEFIINAVDTKFQPAVYELRDGNNEIVRGRFYEQELQKVDNAEQIYIIEKVIKTKGKDGHKQALVKWQGYDKPTWIPHNRITTLQKI